MSNPLSAFPRVRPRRTRANPSLRALVREHTLSATDLIQPLFVHDGPGPDQPIASMPGQFRYGLASLIQRAGRAVEAGVPAVALFPKINDSLKSEDGREAWNPEGIIPRAVGALRAAHPTLVVITDVALDPYSSLGQDGIVVDGDIHNERTLAALIKQSACHAEAGATVVAPSDMMDGRIGAIRDHLDSLGHFKTLIMAYSAKYASAFYGPFRDALDSAPRGGADKATYQLDPPNGNEALHEVRMDWAEGADIVMVKPGMPYLDILYRVKQAFARPTAVYQVSGEYAMLKAAAEHGWLDEQSAVLESLIAFKRAGADMILTYYATKVATWLKS